MMAPDRPDVAITVLLVDDQTLIGSALRRLLAGERDIELHCCQRAADAIEHANHIRPTVILQDLVMPNIDGLTLVGLFRKNAITAATPVIVLSGNDDQKTRARAMAAGASGYLVKLPTKDELVACLRRHAIGRVAGGEETRAAEAAPNQDANLTLDPVVVAPFLRVGVVGHPDSAPNVIDQFIDEAASRIATLNDAAQRRDVAVLKATAHALKGASLVMGARRLAALCARLEDDLRSIPAGAAVPAPRAFDDELARVRDAFARERQHAASRDQP
jgi:DNA-binding NarL/FixJ family response regulator